MMRQRLSRSNRAKAFLLAMAWACLLLAAPRCLAGEGEKVLEENWYALYLNEKKAGYSYGQVIEKRAGDAVTYESRLHNEFTLSRGEIALRFVMDTTITEGPEGLLVAFRHQVRGPMFMDMQGTVEGGELVITAGTGRASKTVRVPVHEGLCPWALHRLKVRMGHEPGTKYSVKAFIPDMPTRAHDVSVELAGKEDVQVFEVTKSLYRSNARFSAFPGLSTSEWSDESDTVWLTRARLLANLTLESRMATKELALAPDDPSDILAASAIPTDKPIPDPRQLDHLRILLQPVEGNTAELKVPAGPYQEVEQAEDGLQITIRQAEVSPDKSYELPYGGEEYAEMARPNVWMETEDPLVAEMSRQAARGHTDALVVARRIEGFVRRTITEKNLSLGFATAAETAAQKAGDCTEHAVLAAALARAAGMPSRVVGGLVYVEGLPGVEGGGFGYHMWTEVYVGEWLPLDAALGGHDATHLALVRSDLNAPGDLLMLSAAISRLFGGARILVLETGQ